MQSTVNNLIEKTRQHLIAQYGENKTEIIGGRTYRKINSYLESFEKFQAILFKFAKKINFPIEEYENELSILFEFCKDCEYVELDAMTKSLTTKNANKTESTTRGYRAKFLRFFRDLTEIANSQPIDYGKIRASISTNIGISLTTFTRHTKFAIPKSNQKTY